jgi:hypothetical protein
LCVFTFCGIFVFFFFKAETAYEVENCDWSFDVFLFDSFCGC